MNTEYYTAIYTRLTLFCWSQSVTLMKYTIKYPLVNMGAILRTYLINYNSCMRLSQREIFSECQLSIGTHID